MAGSEARIRQRLIKILTAAGLDPVSVESSCSPGLPDLNCASGAWLEIKQVLAWPARGGPVRVPHFSPQQRLWLKRRCAAGGRAYLLLRVARDWMLLVGGHAAEHVGKLTRAQYESGDWGWFWAGGLDEQALIRVLGWEPSGYDM